MTREISQDRSCIVGRHLLTNNPDGKFDGSDFFKPCTRIGTNYVALDDHPVVRWCCDYHFDILVRAGAFG